MPRLASWVTHTAQPMLCKLRTMPASGVPGFSSLLVEISATLGAQAAISAALVASLSPWLATFSTSQRRSAPDASSAASSTCSMSPVSRMRPSELSSIITSELSSSSSGISIAGASTRNTAPESPSGTLSPAPSQLTVRSSFFAAFTAGCFFSVVLG